MQTHEKLEVITQLRQLPGIGPSLAQDLYDLGIRSCKELIQHDPKQLYKDLCTLRNARIDRCVLYVFRCVHYYVTNTEHDPELLKWWNWKDRK